MSRGLFSLWMGDSSLFDPAHEPADISPQGTHLALFLPEALFPCRGLRIKRWDHLT